MEMQCKPKIIKWGDGAINQSQDLSYTCLSPCYHKNEKKKEGGKRERKAGRREKEKKKFHCIYSLASVGGRFNCEQHSVLCQHLSYQHCSASQHTSWEISQSWSPVANLNTLKGYGGICTFIDLPLTPQTVPALDCNCS